MSAYDAAKKMIKSANPMAVLQPQPATLWQGEFPLPPGVTEYFIEFGPVDIWIESYGNPYSFPSLSKLWDWQAGYRYHGITKERIDDWDDDWLVIADQGGDPFIVSRSSGAILFAFHGEGSWHPDPMFRDLTHMVSTLSILGDIVATAGKEFTDEDSMICEAYRLEAHKRVAKVLQSDNEAESVLSSLGWG